MSLTLGISSPLLIALLIRLLIKLSHPHSTAVVFLFAFARQTEALFSNPLFVRELASFLLPTAPLTNLENTMLSHKDAWLRHVL